MEVALGLVAAAILLGLMLTTVADVVGRYLLGRSLRGAFELTELALVVLIFAGLPLTSAANQHVTMDFIDTWLSRPNLLRWRRAANLLASVLIGALAVATALKAEKIAAYADTTDILRIPVAPFVYLMAVATLVTALVHLGKCLLGERKPEHGSADPEGNV